MKLGAFFAIAAFVAIAACVPSAEEPKPRGAIGFSLVPSQATRGVPFTTRDGYTLTIERLVVRLDVNASEGGGQCLIFGLARISRRRLCACRRRGLVSSVSLLRGSFPFRRTNRISQSRRGQRRAR